MTEIIMQGADVQAEGRPKRFLLVVDGDAAHLYYTGILLQRLEYVIHTTKMAEDALEILNVAMPSLILTDTSLLRMNGLEFLKEIKKNPKTREIPVLVYSLSRDTALREACLNEGAAAFLPKPVDPEELYAAIQKATEERPRSYIRLTTCLNVIIGSGQVAGAESRNECVTAISEHGMYVSTSKPYPAGSQVSMTLLLGNASMKIDGRVLYSFDNSKSPLRTPGMGIKFSRINPGDQALIKAFIGKQITGGLRQAE